MDTKKTNLEMNDASICQFPATKLVRMIRERQLSAVEVVQAHLKRIEQINPALNAVIEIAPESSLEQARDADAAIASGEQVGPLHGVPFTVKDVYEVCDCARLMTAPGMASRPGEPARKDSTAVIRLRAAGAILIGVTKATLWVEREERYGLTHNPYDLSLSPGGSSGGEAATIAAGGSPLGMGSDSGGSLREPAHFCGIATIRPSNGRVPRSPDAGENDSRTVSGPLARTVEDVATALDVVRGLDWVDPMAISAPLANWRDVSLTGLRVSAFSDNGIVAPTRETVATVAAAARVLADAGMIVDEERPPGLDESWEITLAYWKWGDSGNLKEYKTFLSRWHQYKLRMLDYMRTRDLVLCPVEAFPAPPLGKSEIGTGPSVTYTTPFSLLGWPVATVRAGSSREGLPIGVQLVASPWRDDVALAAAAAVESASGGWQPPRHSPSSRIK